MVEPPTPLKNMISSVGTITFPRYGKIKNVPNHQPDHLWFIHGYHVYTIYHFHTGFCIAMVDYQRADAQEWGVDQNTGSCTHKT